MRFGIFHTPFHLPNTQNPNLALRRDVEMVKLYDLLGYDEVWFGEHHSGGCELIVDPLTFIAHVAPQTQRIKLGTGVISLPYHNPLWIAERITFVDHLTRGRAMYGLGVGALPSDAHMIGMDPTRAAPGLRGVRRRADAPAAQRRADLDLDRALHAQRRARACSSPTATSRSLIAAVVSPSGPRIAGKHGLGLLSIAATMEGGADALAGHWDVVEQRSAEFGVQAAGRDAWTLLGPMHIAETREQAIEDVRYGIDAWFDYMQHVSASPQFSPAGDDHGRAHRLGRSTPASASSARRTTRFARSAGCRR